MIHHITKDRMSFPEIHEFVPKILDHVLGYQITFCPAHEHRYPQGPVKEHNPLPKMLKYSMTDESRYFLGGRDSDYSHYWDPSLFFAYKAKKVNISELLLM